MSSQHVSICQELDCMRDIWFLLKFYPNKSLIYAVHNHQNGRIYAVNKQDIPSNDRLMFQRQKPASVMTWAGVTSTREKTPLFFIEKGLKVSQHIYMELLGKKLVSWVNATFEKYGIILQQDRATSCMANLVQEWCKRDMVVFWPKELWSPCSPDLNSMDFAIWSILKSKACSSNHQLRL